MFVKLLLQLCYTVIQIQFKSFQKLFGWAVGPLPCPSPPPSLCNSPLMIIIIICCSLLIHGHISIVVFFSRICFTNSWCSCECRCRLSISSGGHGMWTAIKQLIFPTHGRSLYNNTAIQSGFSDRNVPSSSRCFANCTVLHAIQPIIVSFQHSAKGFIEVKRDGNSMETLLIIQPTRTSVLEGKLGFRSVQWRRVLSPD